MAFLKTLLIVLASFVLFVLICVVFGAVKLYRYAIRRRKPNYTFTDGLPLDRMRHKGEKKGAYEPLAEQGIKWMQAHKSEGEEVFITSHDGWRLRGALFPCDDPRALVIESHGFHSVAEADFAPTMPFFEKEHCVVLQIDHRAHARSEGKQLSFGVLERYDIKRWMHFAAERYPGLPILLYGVSMGCASVMYAAELPDLPESFCGVIADCGYDDPYKEVRWFVRHFFKIYFPDLVLRPANLICRALAGFSLRVPPVSAGADKIAVPVLYLHGTADDVVPPENAKIICKALGERAKLLIVDDALHGGAYLEAPELVGNAMHECIEQCIEKRNA